MKHTFRIYSLPFFICLLFLVCTCSGASRGAGSSNYVVFNDAAENEIYPRSAPQAERDFTLAGEREDAQYTGQENTAFTRKLVKRAELRLRVEDPTETEKPLIDLIQKYNAWTASTGIYENSRNYSIRVPSPSYDAMLDELADLGRILRRTENAEDVTLRYYDLESRLATRRELLRTYQGYLIRANSIDEIMTVERHITELQYEIDQTGTQFRNLANLVDYSTINVEIVGPVNAVSYSAPTLGEKLRELFGSFGNVASSTLVVLMGIIIYGVPAVLIIILLFWVLFGRIGLLKKLWRFAAAKK